MIKNNFRQILIAVLLFCFSIFQSEAQGPISPEVTGFEPVDVTDVVNLQSGDFTYVIPLLNVPNPEGGYPIGLSYHAGIGVEQEASWVGLGWNVNPGVINRNINGYPDDWKEAEVLDLIYSDLGTQEIFSVGVSKRFGISNISASYSWVNGKGFGGTVGLNLAKGVMETEIGFGGNKTRSMSLLGGAYSIRNGVSSVGLRFGPVNFSVSEEGDFSFSASTKAVGISFGSKGGGVSVLGASFEKSSNLSNEVSSRGWKATLPIPLFSNLTFDLGYSRDKYWVFDTKDSYINGGLYFNSDLTVDQNNKVYVNQSMDVKKLGNELSNGALLPNYDNYNVSAQGLMTTIKPMVFEFGTLVGQTSSRKEELFQGTSRSFNSLEYRQKEVFDNSKDNSSVHFYDINSLTSYLSFTTRELNNNDLLTNMNSLTDVEISSSLESVFEGKSFYNTRTKRKGSENFIESYTNEEINNGLLNFIEAENFQRSNTNELKKSIGAFKITVSDGKTYHYSLPVYNYEVVSKSYDKEKGENKSVFKKYQLSPYASHWLLTAITGPDYVDTNEDGILNESDYGYWVKFNYGKWTDGYVWEKEPVETTAEVEEKLRKSVFEAFGVKELYYLNKVTTRTHSAIFLKSERRDNIGASESYKRNYEDVEKDLLFNNKKYATGVRFQDINFVEDIKLSKKKSLKLDKIILVKNENLSSFNLNYSNQPDENLSNDYIKISSTGRMYDALGRDLGRKNHTFKNREFNNGHYTNNVFLSKNYSDTALERVSIKSIDFEFSYDLSKKGTDNEGKLTLTNVHPKGKGLSGLLPSYDFEYNLPNHLYNKDNFDDWGYDKNNPSAWSLNKITTPIGSSIEIEYEKDDFSKTLFKKNIEEISPEIESINDESGAFVFKFKVLWNHPCYSIKESFSCIEINNSYDLEFVLPGPIPSGGSREKIILRGEVIRVDEDGYVIKFQQNLPNGFKGDLKRLPLRERGKVNFLIEDCINNQLIGKCQDSQGGIRVSEIRLKDQTKEYKTNYYYNVPNSDESSGVTLYSPYLTVPENLKKIIPKTGVNYEYVKVVNNNYISELYKYNVPKDIQGNTRLESQTNVIIDGFLHAETNSLNKTNVTIEEDRESHSLVKSDLKYNNIVIKNNFQYLGSINEIISFNKEGQITSSRKFNYDFSFNNKQGKISESFVTYQVDRELKEDDRFNTKRLKKEYFVNVITDEQFPLLLESIEETSSGFSITKYFDKYDFITGEVLETRTYLSDGRGLKTKIIPAFNKYSVMGSKVDDIDNKNMLLQSAGEISYLLKNGVWKEIGASVTTWRNNWVYLFDNNNSETSNDVWRKHKTYTWNGDLASDNTYANFVEFDYNTTATNLNWRKISETTKYNQFSQPLEVKDINNNYASTKMGDNYTKVMATSNAAYEDMYYNGAEYTEEGSHQYLGGNVLTATATARVLKAHTGRYSMQIDAGKKSFQVNVPRREERNTDLRKRFKVSVWVRKGGENNTKILLDTSQKPFNISEKIYAGDWVQLNGYIDIPISGASVAITCTSGTIYADDFRLHPISSSMMSYVYNEWDEVSYIMGANGLSTHYIYDAAGRLIETQAEVIDKVPEDGTGGFKKVSKNSYNYKRNNN